jgi:hypothetical protein
MGEATGAAVRALSVNCRPVWPGRLIDGLQRGRSSDGHQEW